jgi:hypothetical protein
VHASAEGLDREEVGAVIYAQVIQLRSKEQHLGKAGKRPRDAYV